MRFSYERLKGAIQIVSYNSEDDAHLMPGQRTESFDDMPMNASDPRFDVFYDLEAYLRKTFPALSVIHAHE